MKKETRKMCYDEDLQVEACRFEGIMQPFPVHFHSYYVIGFVESGGRYLTCGNAGCSVGAGDVLVFNPQDKDLTLKEAYRTFFTSEIYRQLETEEKKMVAERGADF